MTSSRRAFVVAAVSTGTVLALSGAPIQKAGKSSPIGDKSVGPAEDLMREHGVLNRILLIYEENIRRIANTEPLRPELIQAAAGIIRRFLEDYHEKLEEDHLFPRFERAHQLSDLVAILRKQHLAGRVLTHEILDLSRAEVFEQTRAKVAEDLTQFIRMYRPHEAREDTVLFPALRDLVTNEEYQRLGDSFEERERKVLGEKGFERIVEEVDSIERELGIEDLALFTPKV